MKKTLDTEGITKRLDAIIRLLIEDQKINNKTEVGQQILVLESAGLSNKDIANILGIKDTSIPSMKPKKKRQ